MGEHVQWMTLLESAGAIEDGHFLLSSGLHSERYVQCALALEHPDNAARLGEGIANAIQTPVDHVLAAPLGGLIIGYEVARQLDVPFVFPERDSSGELKLRRGFQLSPDERICIVEDVITTGKTTRELHELISQLGAQVVAICSIVDRSETHRVGGQPIHSLLQFEIPTFVPEECPSCQRGLPLQQPGSRKMNSQEGI